MELDQERVAMITQAIGRAVLEMRFSSVRLTEYALSEKLEDMREKESNVIGKGVLRDAAELVRSGKL